jgi:outer membrane protease
VGADFNYLSSKYDYGFGYNYKFTALYIGARGSYHLSDDLNIGIDELDLYGTGTVGFRSFTWSDNFGYSTASYGNGIYVGVSAGAKYYFTDKIGAFLELGATGSSNARLGIAFKL